MANDTDSPVTVIDAVLAHQSTGTRPSSAEWNALRRLRNQLDTLTSELEQHRAEPNAARLLAVLVN